jgi:hypothetical protein
VLGSLLAVHPGLRVSSGFSGYCESSGWCFRTFELDAGKTLHRIPCEVYFLSCELLNSIDLRAVRAMGFSVENWPDEGKGLTRMTRIEARIKNEGLSEARAQGIMRINS